MCCHQIISEKIDENMGMNPLASAPKEHLCHIKIPIMTVLYNGANNLLVFNTWLTKVLAYCSTYEHTGPARDRALGLLQMRIGSDPDGIQQVLPESGSDLLHVIQPIQG
jgi:hypothetical protein